jgi:hypothetical protein
VRKDATVGCWGSGRFNKNGDATFVDRAAPVRVPGVDGARRISVGPRSACALGKDGRARCWGYDTVLSEDYIRTPLRLRGVDNGRLVAVTTDQGCVLQTSGALRCWGDNAP